MIPLRYWDVNVCGTQRLLLAMAKAGAAHDRVQQQRHLYGPAGKRLAHSGKRRPLATGQSLWPQQAAAERLLADVAAGPPSPSPSACPLGLPQTLTSSNGAASAPIRATALRPAENESPTSIGHAHCRRKARARAAVADCFPPITFQARSPASAAGQLGHPGAAL